MQPVYIQEATDVFYEHYHKAHGDETCYEAVRRAIGHVVEYVAGRDSQHQAQREGKGQQQLSLPNIEPQQ